MCDVKGQEESSPQTPAPKKPYTPPEIRELGRLQELTRGGSEEQRGEGPGISL